MSARARLWSCGIGLLLIVAGCKQTHPALEPQDDHPASAAQTAATAPGSAEHYAQLDATSVPADDAARSPNGPRSVRGTSAQVAAVVIDRAPDRGRQPPHGAASRLLPE